MKKHNYPGRLITFCGLDGCGKTTMIQHLYDYLLQEGCAVDLTKQPTEAVRKAEIFRTYMDSPNHEAFEYRSLAFMAASDRIQHTVKYIEPLLQEGKIVISDRYFYSCLANLHARGYEHDRWIYEVAEFLIEPDLAFFLDVDVKTAINRVRIRIDEKDRFIDEKLQYRLRDAYLQIAKVNGYPVIRTDRDCERTFLEIRKKTEEIIT